MNAKFIRALLSVAISATMLWTPRPLHADDEEQTTFSVPPSYEASGLSAAGEAAKAVVGRVFGVNGDAGRIDYHVVDMNNRSPVNAGIRSAVFPGWGQHFNRQPVKGTVFILTFAGATIGALNRYNKSKNDYDDYKALGSKDSTIYNDYESSHNQALLLGGAAIGIWIFAIVDAYRNAYNPLYIKDTNIEVAYNSNEGMVKVSKKF